VINWFAIGFSWAEATNARFILLAATGLKRRDRPLVRLRAAVFPFAVVFPFEDLLAVDFAADFFAGVFFLAGAVVAAAVDEVSWAGMRPGSRTRARVRGTKYRKCILTATVLTQRRIKPVERSAVPQKHDAFRAAKTVYRGKLLPRTATSFSARLRTSSSRK
jgi:hypothetical protein